MCAKAAWARVVKDVEISAYLAKAPLKGFDQMWGLRTSLCKEDRMRVTWNWKCQRMHDVRHFDLSLGGLEVVLGWCGGGDPWFGGLSLVVHCYLVLCYSLHGGMMHPRGSDSPSMAV